MRDYERGFRSELDFYSRQNLAPAVVYVPAAEWRALARPGAFSTHIERAADGREYLTFWSRSNSTLYADVPIYVYAMAE